MPGQQSEITAAPTAPASKSRTEGDQPAATMSARVALSCQRALE